MAETSSQFNVKGLSELQKFLDQLTVKLEKNIMRGALRAGAKTILTEAKANVPVKSGELRDSLKIGTKSRAGKVTASVRTKLFYARFVEFGTAAHVIGGKNGGWLSFGGTFTKAVDHPGAKPYPFMRPALDGQAQNAVVATAEYIKRRLTKEGLNASDVEISTEDNT